jgi:hypothetical protein
MVVMVKTNKEKTKEVLEKQGFAVAVCEDLHLFV